MSERTVRHRDDGPTKYLGPVRTAPGHEKTVDAEMAAYLVEETGYFEYVDDEPDTCQAVKSDGEECGREPPCQYHSED